MNNCFHYMYKIIKIIKYFNEVYYRVKIIKKVQQNSVNLTCIGPDRCQIIGYSKLSDSTYTNLSCYVQFFVTAPILVLHN
jgi:hypothetical protein